MNKNVKRETADDINVACNALMEKLWEAVDGVPFIRVLSVVTTFLAAAIQQGAENEVDRESAMKAVVEILRHRLHTPLYGCPDAD